MNNKNHKINSINRLERKWMLENIDITSFFIAIYRSEFLFTEVFKNRNINTIYYDDANFSSIRENLDGVNYKKKYRLRWYGNSKIINKPQFEIKTKIGFVTKKITHPIETSKNFNFNVSGIKEITDIVLDKFKINKNLTPILSTHYLRNYFISSNKFIRATFDRDLKSHQIYGFRNLDFKKDFNKLIFEIKYDKKFDNYVRKNLRNISSRLSKSSKYISMAFDKPISFS
jgi:hypothetical protein